MARKANVNPSYLLHKQSGQARVRINGRDHMLGPFGSEESRKLYGQLIAQAAGGIAIDPLKSGSSSTNGTSAHPASGLTINELVLAFMRHADGHYVKDGKPTSEIHCLKAATSPLVKLYGFTAVDEFGPLMLKAVRQNFIEAGWVRESCNKGVNVRTGNVLMTSGCDSRMGSSWPEAQYRGLQDAYKVNTEVVF
jgi:hypothetical protein